jgi:hypothetical protein
MKGGNGMKAQAPSGARSVRVSGRRSERARRETEDCLPCKGKRGIAATKNDSYF